ncbi:MAG: hypothetical protein Fur0012_03630 [Elusimicrobiota bacterium]
MKKKFAFAAVLAAMAAFFASDMPDGLDRTAQILGFADKVAERGAVFGGYKFPFMSDNPVSTLLASLAGIFLIYAVFLSARFFSVKKQNAQVK